MGNKKGRQDKKSCFSFYKSTSSYLILQILISWNVWTSKEPDRTA
jgi:hypothetical protein